MVICSGGVIFVYKDSSNLIYCISLYKNIWAMDLVSDQRLAVKIDFA